MTADIKNNAGINKKGMSFYISSTILAIVSIACIYPMLMLISISLSKDMDIFKYGYSIIPKSVTTLAYVTILLNPSYLIRSYMVTIFVTLIGSILALWMNATLAYVVSRRDYHYRNKVSFYVFLTMLFNGGLVPTYILIVNWLNLKNTILALIVPYLVSAWFVLVLKGFFQSIPSSIIESAKVEGASELLIFIRLILPVSKPALAAVGLLLTLQYWNDWFLCLLYIDKERLYTLQYMLIRVLRHLEFLNSAEAQKYMGAYSSINEVPTLSARMAMCVFAAGPMLFVFPFFQKYFVKGITLGSVKG